MQVKVNTCVDTKTLPEHKQLYNQVEDLQYIFADKDGFRNKVFDKLLSAGFYRMQHLMFTCNATYIDETFALPVFWLRTLVHKVKLGKSAITILKRCANFKVHISNAYVDEEIEQLYAAYKKHVPFNVSSSCNSYLHDEISTSPFDSKMIQVFDDDKLIATGFFDKSENAIAGIMNIYHPEYKSYSLGKFLMLQKLKFAAENNIEFYYTGYISTKSKRFDYKVFPDIKAVEVLLPLVQQWMPFEVCGKTFLADYYAKYLLVN